MVEPVRHRQTKEAGTDMFEPKATAPHLDSTATTFVITYRSNRRNGAQLLYGTRGPGGGAGPVMGSLTSSIERKSAHDRASREATLSRALCQPKSGDCGSISKRRSPFNIFTKNLRAGVRISRRDSN